jgi:hypothetical protein
MTNEEDRVPPAWTLASASADFKDQIVGAARSMSGKYQGLALLVGSL